MEVKIPKEIRSHRESIFFGLSLRQFICSLGAVTVAVIVYLALTPVVGKETAGWVCIGGTYCCRRLFSLQRHDLWRICVRLCQVTNSLCARARFCLREFLLYRIGSKGA